MFKHFTPPTKGLICVKLPNGYGTVYKLSGNRRRPFVVKKSVNGKQKALGYFESYQAAFEYLVEINHCTPSRDVTFSAVYYGWKARHFERVNNLALDAAGKSATIRASSTSPCFRAIRFFCIRGITMDRYENVSATSISLIADFSQAVALEYVRHAYASGVKVISDKFTNCQRYITFAKACFFIDSARVRIPARRMARVNKYVHRFSSPFEADFTVPPI